MEPRLTKEELAAKLAEKRSVIDARLYGLRREFSKAQDEFVDTVRDRAVVSLLIVVGTGALVGWGYSRWRHRRQAERIADYVMADMQPAPARPAGAPLTEPAVVRAPVVVHSAPPEPPPQPSFLGGVLKNAVRMLVAQGLVVGVDRVMSQLLETSAPPASPPPPPGDSGASAHP